MPFSFKRNINFKKDLVKTIRKYDNKQLRLLEGKKWKILINFKCYSKISLSKVTFEILE